MVSLFGALVQIFAMLIARAILGNPLALANLFQD
jgi:hypothetical protein